LVGKIDELTPAMKQYMEIKGQHKDCIIFFRMGDFYETFFDDAKVTAETLDIALTRRGMKNDASIPLAGIPYHSLDPYLSKMVRKGHKVAIVEQLEDPRFAKGLVKRGLVRIVTPGTFLDQNLLTKSNNFIACVFLGDKIGISLADITTGEFFVTELESMDELEVELSKHNTLELLVPSSKREKLKDLCKRFFTTEVSDVDYYIENARKTLMDAFSVISLEGYGLAGKDDAVRASGAMLSYLQQTQKTSLLHINTIRYYNSRDFMLLDGVTIANLELLGPEDKPSLLKVIDHTTTSMGARLLKSFMLRPLLDAKKINERLLSVEELFTKSFIHDEIRGLLKNIADIERLIARINIGNSNPRDLVLLQGSLEIIPDILKYLSDMETPLLGKVANMKVPLHITQMIDEAIVDDPPAYIQEGNFIKEGYNEDLDRLRSISGDAKRLMAQIEDRERQSTGIKSLKIKYNRIFGYYLDITNANLHLVPPHFIKKQTLVNSERYITEELKKLEEEILSADEKRVDIEIALYQEIVDAIVKETTSIQHISKNIAYLDVLSSFAKAAQQSDYVKPLVTDGFRLALKRSRHPIVEKLSSFITNDVMINEGNRMMILTGPNMAGKSVFMKQVALNVLLAQIGCFVACESAEIPVVDKIFSRTGATDDISMGHSTFMVEMTETAQILNNATDRSLVILDEIGRGTSTYDGVSIAWAVAEHLAAKIKAKTLFATHYHVLNDLEKHVKGVKNYNIAVREKDDQIIFLRKIVEGGTDKSYGIHVAKLAGMPKEVIEKSREIQFRLERDDEIAEKIIIETRKTEQKDAFHHEVEEVDRLIKSKQKTLGDDWR
jgi:DNA mismatch repair protein MutS